MIKVLGATRVIRTKLKFIHIKDSMKYAAAHYLSTMRSAPDPLHFVLVLELSLLKLDFSLTSVNFLDKLAFEESHKTTDTP